MNKRTESLYKEIISFLDRIAKYLPEPKEEMLIKAMYLFDVVQLSYKGLVSQTCGPNTINYINRGSQEVYTIMSINNGPLFIDCMKNVLRRERHRMEQIEKHNSRTAAEELMGVAPGMPLGYYR